METTPSIHLTLKQVLNVTQNLQRVANGLEGQATVPQKTALLAVSQELRLLCDKLTTQANGLELLEGQA